VVEKRHEAEQEDGGCCGASDVGDALGRDEEEEVLETARGFLGHGVGVGACTGAEGAHDGVTQSSEG